MIDCKSDCKWYERCDAASGFKYHRENCPTFERVEIHVPVTNADRIRTMTDEELAMWINDVTTNALSVLALGSNKQTKTIFYWLNWLKQEADV